MRFHVTIWLVILITAVAVCFFLSRKSTKDIARDVSLLLAGLLPPMIGNLIIIISHDEMISYVGSYIYFLGMDFVIVCLLRFTMNYCSVAYMRSKWRILINVAIASDVIQILANIVFSQAFYLEPIMVDGDVYYALVALYGQMYHRVVVYGVFVASLIIFIHKTLNAPPLHKERFFVILVALAVSGAWETFYIVSRAPVDCSMLAFGFFGVLVFYFSLHYRPHRLLDRMLSDVVNDSSEGVLILDAEDKCLYSNGAVRRMLGLDANVQIERLPNTMRAVLGGAVGQIREGETVSCSVRINDEERYWRVTKNKLEDSKGRFFGSYVTVYDETESRLQLDRERYLANHDRLTGLYNKEHLYEEIEAILRDNPDTDYSIVALNIKNFKLVNDVFSKEFGDRLLCWVADWVRAFSKNGAVCGRISSDRFGFIIPAVSFDAMKVDELCRHASYFDKELGIEYPVVLHLGVIDVADRSKPAYIMFDRAFMSIDTIKNDYHQHIAYYDDAMRDDVLWKQVISGELDEAIAQKQICPYLHPMVNKDGAVVGAEVLARWNHPVEGLLPPGRFIPVFEENGMIARLDMYMWECACQLLKEWEGRGIDMFLSVNISPKDFYFIDVHGTIRALVEKYGIDSSKLRLEITETVMMSDMENRLKIIEELRSDGFLVEMDDFGSGYSSLNMLKEIPVDVLKIDMMFLYKTKDQDKAQTILQTIINLSDNLGIPSITEGVETADQLEMLVSMGCSLFQGFYFAKPMPVKDFEEQYRAA